MRITAHGHPAIKASHAKTFELTEDADIGPRATCVIGVGARVEGRCPHGPIELTLTVGDHCRVVHAEANPFGRGLVVRQSDFLGADTLAIDADAAASDLDRALVHALQDPGANLVVTVRPAGPSKQWAVFDDVSTPSLDGEVVATTALGQIRACAAMAGGGPVLLLDDLRPAARKAAMASAGVVVWRGRGAEAEKLLKLPGAVVAIDRGEAATRIVARVPDRIPAGATVTVAVPGSGGGGEGDDAALLQALKAEGVSARTLKQALARIGRRVDYTDL